MDSEAGKLQSTRDNNQNFNRSRSFKSKQLVRSRAIRESRSPPVSPRDCQNASGSDSDRTIDSAHAKHDSDKQKPVEIQITPGSDSDWGESWARRRWPRRGRSTQLLSQSPRIACVCGECRPRPKTCPQCRGRRRLQGLPHKQDSGIVCSDDGQDCSESDSADGPVEQVQICTCAEKTKSISNKADAEEPSGLELAQFIKDTLNKHPRDRSCLLMVEKELRTFVSDPSRSVIRFPVMSSYGRMLVHRCATLFQLVHQLDQTNKACVLVSKNGTSGGRIPCTEFSQWCSVTFPETVAHQTDSMQARSILKRDAHSLDEAGCGAGAGTVTRSKSLEQREKDYERVRQRIFNSEDNPWPWLPGAPVKLLTSNTGRNRLLKVQSLETGSGQSASRGAVSKSYSFGGYGREELPPSHSTPTRLLSRQGDLASSSWRLSPSSSGYKTLSLRSTDSITPSPTGGVSPELNVDPGENGVWHLAPNSTTAVIHPQQKTEHNAEKKRGKLEKQNSFMENEYECPANMNNAEGWVPYQCDWQHCSEHCQMEQHCEQEEASKHDASHSESHEVAKKELVISTSAIHSGDCAALPNPMVYSHTQIMAKNNYEEPYNMEKAIVPHNAIYQPDMSQSPNAPSLIQYKDSNMALPMNMMYAPIPAGYPYTACPIEQAVSFDESKQGEYEAYRGGIAPGCVCGADGVHTICACVQRSYAMAYPQQVAACDAVSAVIPQYPMGHMMLPQPINHYQYPPPVQWQQPIQPLIPQLPLQKPTSPNMYVPQEVQLIPQINYKPELVNYPINNQLYPFIQYQNIPNSISYQYQMVPQVVPQYSMIQPIYPVLEKTNSMQRRNSGVRSYESVQRLNHETKRTSVPNSSRTTPLTQETIPAHRAHPNIPNTTQITIPITNQVTTTTTTTNQPRREDRQPNVELEATIRQIKEQMAQLKASENMSKRYENKRNPGNGILGHHPNEYNRFYRQYPVNNDAQMNAATRAMLNSMRQGKNNYNDYRGNNTYHHQRSDYRPEYRGNRYTQEDRRYDENYQNNRPENGCNRNRTVNPVNPFQFRPQYLINQMPPAGIWNRNQNGYQGTNGPRRPPPESKHYRR